MEQLWYNKLKEEGFQDIEDTKTGMLKEWDSIQYFRHSLTPLKYESTLHYYALAKEMLSFYDFKNELHKKIWEHHSDGLSERKIALKIRKYKKSMIHYIIANIAKTIKVTL